MEWGTAGEWAAAIGGVGVIVVTLALWRHEVGEKRREEELRVARCVNAWLQNDDRFYFVASNTSDEPIYEWSATAAWDLPLPQGHQTRTLDATNFGPLHPGRQVKLAVEHPLFGHLRDVTVTVEFTDPRGVRWLRTDGKLERR